MSDRGREALLHMPLASRPHRAECRGIPACSSEEWGGILGGMSSSLSTAILGNMSWAKLLCQLGRNLFIIVVLCGDVDFGKS